MKSLKINKMTPAEQNNKQRIFVFKQPSDGKNRPMLYAFPEDKIVSVKSQWGSQNVYLEINGLEVQGSFDQFVSMLGERVDVE